MPKGLAELVLIVSDVPRAAAFYRDVVGLLPATTPNQEWAWFWTGEPGVPQRLAVHKGTLLFEEHSPLPPGQRFGRIHFALELAQAELTPALERVRQAGIAVYGPMYFEWMKADSWYFYDPDGNLVELWVQHEKADSAAPTTRTDPPNTGAFAARR